jgi:hypothetical protein
MGNLPPEGTLPYRAISQQLQPAMGIGLHDHPVIPPTAPLAEAEGVMYTAEDLPLCWK